MEMKKRKWIGNKHFLIIIIVLLITLISGMFFYQDHVKAIALQPRSVYTAKSYEQSVGLKVPPSIELSDNVLYEQEIIMVSTVISGISLEIDNSDGQSAGELKVSLRKKGETVSVQEWVYDVSQFKTKGFCSFAIGEEYSVKAGDHYIITVQAYNEGKTPIKLQQAHRRGVTGELRADGLDIEGMTFAYQINNGTCNAIRYLFIMILVLLMAGLVGICVMLLRKASIEKVVFSTILFLGSFFIIVIPPYAVPDEGTHFVTAYAQSNWLLGEEALDDEGIVRGDVGAGTYVTKTEIPNASTYAQYARGLFGKTDDFSYTNVTLRKPIELRQLGYVPQVLGISIGRLTGANAIQIFFLGRLFALLAYAVIMYWATKIMPFGKMILFMVGILPMTLQQAVSYNYDSVLNGTLFLMISFLFYLIYQKERVCWKDVLIVIGLSCIIIPIKFIYFPIVGLGILIPKDKFGGKWRKAVAAFTIAGSGLIIILFMRLQTIINATSASARHSGGISSGLDYYSISYCITHPLDCFKIVFQSITENISFYVESLVGSSLGWFAIEIPGLIIIGFVILLLISSLQEENKSQLSGIQRGVIVGIGGGISLLVMLTFLIAETYIGSDTIIGVQGRYFLPILPLILVSLKNKTIVLKKNINNSIIICALILEMATIMEITKQVICR